MVSQRMVKRKNKSLKRSPRSSPLKDIAASIDRSFRTCRRRLLKLFQKINIQTHGLVLLTSTKEDLHDSRVSPFPIPLPLSSKKRTLFLDLDETLVHTQIIPPTEKYDFVVQPKIGDRILDFYVVKRPGLDLLLKEAKNKQFEVVIFTAGVQAYASLVLDMIDPEKDLISHRLYRESCSEIEGVLVKNLVGLGRDLRTVVIVDDNPNSFMLQPGNAFPVKPFVNDLSDRELWRVMEFLSMAGEFEDTREAVKVFLSATKEQLAEPI